MGKALTSGQILEKFSRVCRNHVLHGRCRLGEACTRDHTKLNQADTALLWNAAKELYPREFRGVENGPTADPKQKGDPPFCKFLETETGCHWGDKCQWRHDESRAELLRARKIRAERIRGPSRGQPSGGVHAQAWDPDNPWQNWGVPARTPADDAGL